MSIVMRIDFPEPLIPGRLIRRYKRFLADVELEDGNMVTAHCVNTGRMSGCADEGSDVWLLPAPEHAKRKLKYTWILTRRADGVTVGVHTGLPNQLVSKAISKEVIPELCGYDTVRREVKMGDRSRVDVHLSHHKTHPPCWVEVKNVTLVRNGIALFPDAVTERGRKHLNVLGEQVKKGDRAAMVYVVQRLDAQRVSPADEIDPAYGNALREAIAGGVETYALSVKADPMGLEVVGLLPVAAG